MYKLDQFKAATTTAEFLEALELLKGVGPGNGVEVATVAKTALGKKRENKVSARGARSACCQCSLVQKCCVALAAGAA